MDILNSLNAENLSSDFRTKWVELGKGSNSLQLDMSGTFDVNLVVQYTNDKSLTPSDEPNGGVIDNVSESVSMKIFENGFKYVSVSFSFNSGTIDKLTQKVGF